MAAAVLPLFLLWELFMQLLVGAVALS
jgi:hypothetical protein